MAQNLILRGKKCSALAFVYKSQNMQGEKFPVNAMMIFFKMLYIFGSTYPAIFPFLHLLGGDIFRDKVVIKLWK